jgi:uncharacterized protein YacL
MAWFALALPGTTVTNDLNLNKVAHLRGVEVLNVNDLANSLKPIVGKTIDIVVTSVLQTTAGKMIFGRYIEAGMAAQAVPAAAAGEPREENVRRARSPQPQQT